MPSALAVWDIWLSTDFYDLLRVSVVILTATACVIVGALTRLAGLLWPGLLSAMTALAPTVLVAGLLFGAWIPLLIGGVVLIFVGARLEKLRRAGREVAVWIAHLR